MKIVRFSHQGTTSYGLLEGSSIAVLSGSPFEKIEKTGTVVALDTVRVLAPVAPSKLVCVGLNYTLHAEESGVPVPEEPMLFMCAPSAIIADGEQIQLDNADDRIDFEAEIGIVVGRRARNVAANDAGDYIFGYTCANDVSNRDLQKKDGQFTRAKSFDTYKPVGPVIETDLDPDNVDIKLWQNGELRQSSNTNDMIFPIARIFEFVSGIMTLEPGDLIITGTPSGVGPMASGDEIVIEIEKIGRLHSRVA
ncbi:fumarylacetoacetate hydrolase family protein [Nitratireductor sp. B36]|uniref:fumarylacetoacetate hydrolase family protein n=1 Tax=Nitratireductor sp. B36 TaxID=2762059 RepID=UPI001E3F41BB|nr:fumarylacetoacetate hydrolase family protein [Nitratireductor sp. B36]MCC5781025.1 fumarylacetoacetate hydrolase family protein [Nitratireductor sp. B36]